MLFSKKKKMILLLIPYLLNLFFISTLHYEPRYALFLVIDGAFIATFLSFFLYKKYKLFFTILIFLFTISNSILIAGWLNLASSKDTRVEAIEWIDNNTGSSDFLIYNTLGFNYVALHSKGIKIIQDNFPKAITTRESLHLQYKLNDKTNGMILWKYAQAGYAARDLVRILSENNYNVFLINERFGSDSIHGHRLNDYLSDFEKSTTLELVKMINPFDENVNSEDKAMIGDVLYNFNSVWSTIFSLKRSGPTVSIYKVLEK
jgi:hypothetical protein